MITPDNTLFYGDCLRVLTDDIAPASVDLIYLDPPFNSKRDYNIPLGGKAQASVFQDTWVWSATQDDSLDYVAERDANLYQQLNWLLQFAAGGNIASGGGLTAYLAYMSARLLACKRVLKETGSIYLHCDPTAGHYLKLLMDGVFGSTQFRNEITWLRTAGAKLSQHAPKIWGRSSDTILFYAKTDVVRVQPYRDLTSEEANAKFKYQDRRGRYFTEGLSLFRRPAHGPRPNLCYTWRGFENPHPSGWTLSKERLEEEYQKGNVVITDDGKLERRKYENDYPGIPAGNVWTDIPNLTGKDVERLGYPTQKPLALLERIIRASSDEGDLVLDPFCGCGTAVEAAQNLGRRWLGIDVEPLAVDLMARRLRDRCGVDPQIRGIPYDFEQAQRLAANAPYEFERWAIRLIPGAQPNFKQSGDGGLDGRAVVASNARPQPLFGFQVKGGQAVGRPVLDAFHGALTMNGCAAGLLVVLEEQTAYRLRANLGAQERVQLNGWNGPRIGVWSVEDWLEGRRGAPVPPLVGAGETLELLRPQAWQRRLGEGAN